MCISIKKYFSSPFFYIFLLIIGYFSFTKIIDGDFAFHLAQGKYFFENNWHLPFKEIYSYTIAGQTNIILSWMFDAWIYFIYAKLGFLGLGLWKSAVTAVMAFLFILRLEQLAEAKILRPGSGQVNLNQWIVYAGTFLFLAAVFPRVIMERPQALGYIYFSLFLLLLDSFLRRPQKWHWFSFMGLQLFWTNAHSSFVASIIIIVLICLGLIIEYYSKQKFGICSNPAGKPTFIKAPAGRQEELKRIISQLKQLCLLLVLLVVISNFNPYGADIFNNVLKASPSGVYSKYITEQKPMDFRSFFSFLGVFWLLSLISFIRFWRQRNYKMILVFAAFAFLALNANRFSYDYVVLIAPFALIEIFCWPTCNVLRPPAAMQQLRAGSEAGRLPLFLNTTIVGLVAFFIFFLGFMWVASSRARGIGFSVNDFPIKTADFVQQNQLQGKMFNSFNTGSYLIWRLFPQYQVYIDSRAQDYIEGNNNSLLMNYYQIPHDLSVWQNLDEKYNFNFAIVDWPYIFDNAVYNSTEKIFTSDKWALVFMDAKSIVYLKRNEINQQLIERYEYKYIQPQNFNSQYLKNYLLNSGDWEGASKEFQRALEQTPDNYRIHFLYAAFLSYNPAGSEAEIVDHIKRIIELNPNFEPAKKILKKLKDEKLI